MNVRSLCLGLVAGSLFSCTTVLAEPGWDGHVIAHGELKQQIKSMPIEERPYRPFHVYGNTVRRMYYRGQVLPRPRDLLHGSGERNDRGN